MDATGRFRLVEHLSVIELVLVGVALQGDPHDLVARSLDMKKDAHVIGEIGMAQMVEESVAARIRESFVRPVELVDKRNVLCVGVHERVLVTGPG